MKDYRKELTDQEREQKIAQATEAYSKFMDVILPGWQDDPNSQETPHRVAKMYVNELLAGFYGEEPKITVFPNSDEYTGIVFQGKIKVRSMCSHHHAFFFGEACVAYIPKKGATIIGLSKLNRIVEYYSRRIQVQENLTEQIHNAINLLVGSNRGVAVIIKATHTCVSHRGIGQDSVMQTVKLSGAFLENDNRSRDEFYEMINMINK
jgi:GTP cyclohydrolase IA